MWDPFDRIYGRDERRRGNWYDTALICKNGHVITSVLESHPADNDEKFCNECGAETIRTCLHCSKSIRGYYHMEHAAGGGYSRPGFCIHCGEPFPWTEGALQAARALADESEGLNQDEKELLKNSIEDLVRDTPNTPVAATRFRRLMAKAGKGAAVAFERILIEFMSETAKKIVYPQ
jgi:hypothetical protein